MFYLLICVELESSVTIFHVLFPVKLVMKWARAIASKLD